MKRTKEKINAFQGAITFVNFHSPKLAEDQNLLYSYAAWEPKIIVKNKNKNTSSSPAHTFLFLHTGSGGEDLDDLESCCYVFFGAQRRSNANVSSWQRNMSNESPYTHYTVTRISKNQQYPISFLNICTGYFVRYFLAKLKIIFCY